MTCLTTPLNRVPLSYLPMLLACLAAPTLALDKTEVLGFWSQSVEDAATTLQTEAWFMADFTVELRAKVGILGEVAYMNGMGSWKIVGNKIIVDGNGACVQDQGNGKEPCDKDDTAPDTLEIVAAGGKRSLMMHDEGDLIPFGNYVGAQKKFTLPDLLSATAIAAVSEERQGPMLPRITAGSRPAALSGGRAFDLRGRTLAQPMAPRMR